jgi:hypothetical protein
VEQLDAEVALKIVNGLTERRLLHTKPLSRAREVELLGDSNEMAKMSKLHGTGPLPATNPRHVSRPIELQVQAVAEILEGDRLSVLDPTDNLRTAGLLRTRGEALGVGLT